MKIPKIAENSSSRKHSRFGLKTAQRRQLGGQQQQSTNGTISTTATNVALNDSGLLLKILLLFF